MFRINPIGKWNSVMMLLSNYDKRIKYANEMFVKACAFFLLHEVEKNIPQGPDYDQYRKSLKVVRLIGKNVAYAVVSDREEVKLKNIGETNKKFGTVVYIASRGASVGESSELASILEQNNPWVVDLVPNGIRKGSVSMVHRRVMKNEENAIREQTKSFISENKSLMIKYGASWGDAKDPDTSAGELASLPDYMAMALRAEFGINDVSRPHWRPALSKLKSSLQDIL